MRKKHKYHLGFYQAGQRVRMPCDHPRYPGETFKIIGNYSNTTGVVVIEHEGTGSRVEMDGFQPLHHAYPTGCL